MIVKKKSKVTKALIAVSFLIGIIAIVTPVMAADSNRVLIMAKGDDLDLPGATNLIIGKIEFGGGGELPSVQAVFHQKIYDESGEKVYAMKGKIKDGVVLTNQFAFFCPVFKVYFINVWFIEGDGKFKTTDTVIEVSYRGLFTITMPNTEGKYVPASFVMLLSFTAEYCEKDPADPVYPPGSPDNPIKILDQGEWVVAGVIWDFAGIGPLLIGPVSYLTKYIGI